MFIKRSLKKEHILITNKAYLRLAKRHYRRAPVKNLTHWAGELDCPHKKFANICTIVTATLSTAKSDTRSQKSI